MKILFRIMKLCLPQGQTAFLWGARSTGKSTYLRQKYPDSLYFDLLDTDLSRRLMLQPSLLREELCSMPEAKLRAPVIIDEVQKIPALLDEIHWLIENKRIGFVLCGSSARKLRRGSANLLGGRAWKFHFYPLVYPEIEDFDLLRALTRGLLPSIYLGDYPERGFRAYVDLYLKEEVQAEGLVRNLSGFTRFLELAGFSNGEMLNYKKIATDCGVDAKTVKEYYQILEDTLVGYHLYPYTKIKKRQIIRSTPKFYLFDIGVANYLSHTKVIELKGAIAGKAFEHYIMMELTAYIGIEEKNIKISYWRSKTGLEVDFVLGDAEVAIEVKIGTNPRSADYKGLQVFCDDYSPAKALVVCLAPAKRKTDAGIIIYPWQEFLQDLWSGNII